MTATRRRPSVPVVLLIVASIASATLLLILTSRLTFFLDDWDLLLHRRGFSADSILRPHNEHIIIAPTLIYKALQASFGMDSAQPFQVVAISTFLVSVVLLFAWLRSRVGDWLALFGAVAILFLGSAWEDLLSPFQIGFFGSMACGLGALLALERDTRRADALACALLVGSIMFSSLGLPFLAGGAVAIAMDAAPLRRLWIVAIPALLFAAWWLGWGHDATTVINFQSVASAPRYVLDGVAASVGSLLGLAPPNSSPPVSAVDWGRPLLVLALGVAAWRIYSLRSFPRWLWVVGATTAGFWLLTGINSALFRLPTSPRYVYMGAIFTLLIAAELLRGVRVSRWVLLALVAVGAVTIASNLVNLRDGYRIFKSTTDSERGGITALELARDTVEPAFLLTPENSNAPYFDIIDAGSYLSAVDAFGSPGYSEEELREAVEPTRIAADKALAAALPVTVSGGARGIEPSSACVEVDLTGSGAATVELPLGGGLVSPGARVELSVRRYADQTFPVELGGVPGGGNALVRIPTDAGDEPWEALLAGSGAVRVCGVTPRA